MLKLIEGGFSSPAKEILRNEIIKLTKERKKVFLIVPEQQTVSTEKEMADLLPEYAPITFEVTNFTRFSNTVFRRLGGVAQSYSDKARQSLIMWRTLAELSPVLSLTSTAKEINTGMVQKALTAVTEMKGLGVLSEELWKASENPEIRENRRLVNKLSDLSKIMVLYKKLLSEKYSDLGDDIDAICTKLETNGEIFKDTFFFIEGFTSFTEPQYKLLGLLMKNYSLTVHLVISKGAYDGFEFTELRDTRERLSKLADKSNTRKTINKVDGRNEGQNPLLSECVDLLWRSYGEAIGDASVPRIPVRIYEAQDPYEECDFIASDIRRKIISGNSYRDFAIVTRNTEKYSGIIDSALRKADIPAFMSRSKDVFSFEAIKLICTAFSSLQSGFAIEDVITYAKCGLSGISREACDAFELYTEKWQLTKNALLTDDGWNMSPEGYSRRAKDSTEQLLLINDTRKRLLTPLIKFKDSTDTAKTVRDYATALMGFLSDISLEKSLNSKSLELLAMGETEAAADISSIFKTVCNSLDTLVETLGDCTTDIHSFEAQLRVVLSLLDIGRIPAFFDEVTVGSADMLRLSGKKYVYLLGVNQGEFPKAVKENSYFTDRDKEILSKLGLNTNSGIEVAYSRELYAFSRAFASADREVIILYSLRDASFSPTEKADVVSRVCEIFQNKIAPIKIKDLSASEKIYHAEALLDHICKNHKNAEADVKEILDDAGYSHVLEVSEKDIKNSNLRLGDEALHIAYKGDLALTQTRIDNYNSCPFAYFLRYNLKLSENEKAEFDARNIGSFIHAVLENFFSALEKEGMRPEAMTDDAKRALIDSAAKKYLAEISEGGARKQKRKEVMLERLSHSAMPVVDDLCRELSSCDFIPKYFELEITNDNPALPAPAAFKSDDGKNVFVYGSIDRVDTFKSGEDVYVRVIDYKTGSKSFSPDDIDNGKNLQMFLYLKAITDTKNPVFRKEIGVGENGKIIPAGVIYVKTDIKDVSVVHSSISEADAAVRKNQQRRGMILNDEIAISAMNRDYIPIHFTKGGAPYKESEKYLYDMNGWDELNSKISEKITEISSSMKSGDISTAKKGDDSPCSYCKFKPICRTSKS